MKIQGAICVKHEHIHLRLLIHAGIRLLWRHYLNDSCLNIPAEHEFSSALSLSGQQRPCQSETSTEKGHKDVFLHTFTPQFFHTRRRKCQFKNLQCSDSNVNACIVQNITGKREHSADCNSSFSLRYGSILLLISILQQLHYRTVLALQNFTSCVVKITQSFAELSVAASKGQ